MMERTRLALPAPSTTARERGRRLRRAELLAYLVLGVLVLAVLLLTDRGMIAPDTKPHLYLAPARAFHAALSSWREDPYLGQPNFDAGVAPVALGVMAIRALGVPAWLVIRLWRALLLLVAGAGAAVLYQRVAGGLDERGGGRAHPAGRVVAATLYVVNPYVVVAGASTPVLLPYALLPWLLVALARSVREPRSWRWPAAFGLAFFASSGLNAGIVGLFMLLAVPCWLAFERHANGLPWRQLLVATGRCLLLSLAVSLYWLVPAVLASATGSSIATATEAPRDVAAPSSYAETVRLLGLWTLYGRAGPQPFVPRMIGFLTNPLVVVSTFLIPVAAAGAALFSRSRGRVVGAYLLAVAVPVMVGLFPPGASSPFGRLLEGAFDKVPGAIAFRTTNKAGALAALGITMLVALGAAELATRPGLRDRVRAGAATAGAVVLALAVLPAWTGGLNLARFRIPDYWYQAAHDLNLGSSLNRVLMVPGEVLADYRWGLNGPDDLNESLLTRPSAVRVTVPNGSAAQSNFMAALDTALGNGAPEAGTVSAMARYIGADEVLARYDTRWEAIDGPRPAALEGTLRRDPGLHQGAAYGRPGENTVAGRDAGRGDASLSPLERFSVTGSRPILHAEPSTGTLLVDGDDFALPGLAGQGLLNGQPAIRLLSQTNPEEVAVAMDDGARIVLTDTARRRAWEIHRTGQSFSPTLLADDPIPKQYDGLNLTDDPSEESVTELEGARAVRATSSGTVFGLLPSGKPSYAFDGDPRTAWVTGGFGTAVGQSITIEFGRKLHVSEVSLRPLQLDPVRISSVRITVNGHATDVDIPERPPEVAVPLPPADTYGMTVEITGVRGSGGLNSVGFSEIGIPGVRVSDRVRLPDRFRQVVDSFDQPARERLATTPIDVLLSRVAGDPRRTDDDEESELSRSFWLPDTRTFQASGRMSASTELPEPVIDRLAGASTSATATSSSRAFGSPTVRASRAFDGNRDTAWIPATRGEGEWIQADFPTRRLDHVVVRQDIPKDLGNKQALDKAVKAELSIDGQPIKRVTLGTPVTRIDFPERTAHQARLTIDEVAGLGGGIRISEFHVGGVHLEDAPDAETARLKGCVEVGRIDGTPLRVSPAVSLNVLTSGAPVFFEPCPGQPVRLGPGVHRLTADPGWLLDLLRLESASGGDGHKLRQVKQLPASPRVNVIDSSPTSVTVTTEAAHGAYYLVLGQGYDPRWQATMDGRSLGAPVLLDGYSTGWRITDTRSHVITMRYTPQRWVSASLAASLLAIALLVGLVLQPRWRWRRP